MGHIKCQRWGLLKKVASKSWVAEDWAWETRPEGGRWGRGRTPLTPTASLKQKDLGAAAQGLAAAQLLHQCLWLYLPPVSPQQLSLWPPVGHQGHKGTAHWGPVGI